MTLSDFGDNVLQLFKENLTESGKIASGGLKSTTYDVEFNSGVYKVFFNIPDYYEFVESGRNPGSFPPVEEIKDWIRVKQIVPYPDKYGKVPDENQLAYMIGKKIEREGIPASPVLSDALDEATGSILDAFIDSVVTALQEEVFASL